MMLLYPFMGIETGSLWPIIKIVAAFLMVLFWPIIIIAVVYLIYKQIKSEKVIASSRPVIRSAADILSERYAKGELTKEQYVQMNEDLIQDKGHEKERYNGHYSMKINRPLFKINRISGWLMLIFMFIFVTSGYALTKHIIMPTVPARYLHTTLDIYMMPVFLAHVLINTKFALKRWGFHHDEVVNLVLLLAGIALYVLVLMIRF